MSQDEEKAACLSLGSVPGPMFALALMHVLPGITLSLCWALRQRRLAGVRLEVIYCTISTKCSRHASQPGVN